MASATKWSQQIGHLDSNVRAYRKEFVRHREEVITRLDELARCSHHWSGAGCAQHRIATSRLEVDVQNSNRCLRDQAEHHNLRVAELAETDAILRAELDKCCMRLSSYDSQISDISEEVHAAKTTFAESVHAGELKIVEADNSSKAALQTACLKLSEAIEKGDQRVMKELGDRTWRIEDQSRRNLYEVEEAQGVLRWRAEESMAAQFHTLSMNICKQTEDVAERLEGLDFRGGELSSSIKDVRREAAGHATRIRGIEQVLRETEATSAAETQRAEEGLELSLSKLDGKLDIASLNLREHVGRAKDAVIAQMQDENAVMREHVHHVRLEANEMTQKSHNTLSTDLQREIQKAREHASTIVENLHTQTSSQMKETIDQQNASVNAQLEHREARSLRQDEDILELRAALFRVNDFLFRGDDKLHKSFHRLDSLDQMIHALEASEQGAHRSTRMEFTELRSSMQLSCSQLRQDFGDEIDRRIGHCASDLNCQIDLLAESSENAVLAMTHDVRMWATGRLEQDAVQINKVAEGQEELSRNLGRAEATAIAWQKQLVAELGVLERNLRTDLDQGLVRQDELSEKRFRKAVEGLEAAETTLEGLEAARATLHEMSQQAKQDTAQVRQAVAEVKHETAAAQTEISVANRGIAAAECEATEGIKKATYQVTLEVADARREAAEAINKAKRETADGLAQMNRENAEMKNENAAQNAEMKNENAAQNADIKRETAAVRREVAELSREVNTEASARNESTQKLCRKWVTEAEQVAHQEGERLAAILRRHSDVHDEVSTKFSNQRGELDRLEQIQEKISRQRYDEVKMACCKQEEELMVQIKSAAVRQSKNDEELAQSLQRLSNELKSSSSRQKEEIAHACAGHAQSSQELSSQVKQASQQLDGVRMDLAQKSNRLDEFVQASVSSQRECKELTAALKRQAERQEADVAKASERLVEFNNEFTRAEAAARLRNSSAQARLAEEAREAREATASCQASTTFEIGELRTSFQLNLNTEICKATEACTQRCTELREACRGWVDDLKKQSRGWIDEVMQQSRCLVEAELKRVDTQAVELRQRLDGMRSSVDGITSEAQAHNRSLEASQKRCADLEQQVSELVSQLQRALSDARAVSSDMKRIEVDLRKDFENLQSGLQSRISDLSQAHDKTQRDGINVKKELVDLRQQAESWNRTALLEVEDCRKKMGRQIEEATSIWTEKLRVTVDETLKDATSKADRSLNEAKAVACAAAEDAKRLHQHVDGRLQDLRDRNDTTAHDLREQFTEEHSKLWKNCHAQSAEIRIEMNNLLIDSRETKTREEKLHMTLSSVTNSMEELRKNLDQNQRTQQSQHASLVSDIAEAQRVSSEKVQEQRAYCDSKCADAEQRWVEKLDRQNERLSSSLEEVQRSLEERMKQHDKEVVEQINLQLGDLRRSVESDLRRSVESCGRSIEDCGVRIAQASRHCTELGEQQKALRGELQDSSRQQTQQHKEISDGFTKQERLEEGQQQLLQRHERAQKYNEHEIAANGHEIAAKTKYLEHAVQLHTSELRDELQACRAQVVQQDKRTTGIWQDFESEVHRRYETGLEMLSDMVSIKNHEAALSAKLETSVSDLKSHAELELSMSRNEIVEKLSQQATANHLAVSRVERLVESAEAVAVKNDRTSGRLEMQVREDRNLHNSLEDRVRNLATTIDTRTATLSKDLSEQVARALAMSQHAEIQQVEASSASRNALEERGARWLSEASAQWRREADDLANDVKVLERQLDEQRRAGQQAAAADAKKTNTMEARLTERIDAISSDALRAERGQAEALGTAQRKLEARVEQLQGQRNDFEDELRRHKQHFADEIKHVSVEAAQESTKFRKALEERGEAFLVAHHEVEATWQRQLKETKTDLVAQIHTCSRTAVERVDESVRARIEAINELKKLLEDARSQGEIRLQREINDTRYALAKQFAEREASSNSENAAGWRREAALLTRRIDEVITSGPTTATAAAAALAALESRLEASVKAARSHIGSVAETVKRQGADHDAALSRQNAEFCEVRKQQDRCLGLQEDIAYLRSEICDAGALQVATDVIPLIHVNAELAEKSDKVVEHVKSTMCTEYKELRSALQRETESAAELATRLHLVDSRLTDGQTLVSNFSREVSAVLPVLKSQMQSVQTLEASLEKQDRDFQKNNRDRIEQLEELSEKKDHLSEDLEGRVLEAAGGAAAHAAEELVHGLAESLIQSEQRQKDFEVKLSNCIEWLHGISVKIGINPPGTMLSPRRFRDGVFSDSTGGPPEIGNSSVDAGRHRLTEETGRIEEPTSSKQGTPRGASTTKKAVRRIKTPK